MKYHLTTAAASLVLMSGLTAAPAAQAISFMLDDNPSAPASPLVPPPPGIGTGAEDPFGQAGPPGLAPSPSLLPGGPLGPVGGFGGDILSPGPTLQILSPNGYFIGSLSSNKDDHGSSIYLDFSVDRASTGMPGTAVAGEAAVNSQPGDIFQSTLAYPSPRTFAGQLGGGIGYVGPLPGVPAGPGNNQLRIDASQLGLLCGGAPCPPPGVMAPPITPGSHDNVDGFDFADFDPSGTGVFAIRAYFSVYPDEAAAVGSSAANIFTVAPGTASADPNTPFALASQLGLDQAGLNTDMIDALIMFDRDAVGTLDPGVDYALFSLGPGSASLSRWGLTAADVFFTDFTGRFALYASAGSLGLAGTAGGTPYLGDNIDALELQVPTPGTLALLVTGLMGFSLEWRNRNA
ncbi:MAG: hypothetical protein U1F76_10130 [Candidatus Competibacteraceae bacterium]